MVRKQYFLLHVNGISEKNILKNTISILDFLQQNLQQRAAGFFCGDF
jgi:hypothetical protein